MLGSHEFGGTDEVTKSRFHYTSLRSLVCGSGFLGDDDGVCDGDVSCVSMAMMTSAGEGEDGVEGWQARACGSTPQVGARPSCELGPRQGTLATDSGTLPPVQEGTGTGPSMD